MSLMPRLVISTVTSSLTSWSASRSPVTISTLHAVGRGLGGQRGDDVVGLVTRHRQPRDAERVEHLEDQAQLAPEVGRGLPPVRLVLDVLLVPEGRLAAVERDRDVRRLLVAQHVDEHRGEAVDGVGRLPGRGGEVLRRQREERPVGQRMPVEQQQPAPVRVGLLDAGLLGLLDAGSRPAGAGRAPLSPGAGWRWSARAWRGSRLGHHAGSLVGRCTWQRARQAAGQAAGRRVSGCSPIAAPSGTGGDRWPTMNSRSWTPLIRRARIAGPPHGHQDPGSIRPAGSSAPCRSTGNTQPYGLLHGGASCVLAETLGSLGSALHAGPGRFTVGIEISATHHAAPPTAR